MTPETYVQWLIDLNNSIFKTPEQWLAQVPSFGFGFIEEFFEWQAQTSDPLELGDMVAYYCLLNYSLGRTQEQLTQDLASVSRNHSTETNVGEVAGNLKRYFREGSFFVEDVRLSTYLLLLFAFTTSSLSLEPVLDLNREKLGNRVANVGSFNGRGSR